MKDLGEKAFTVAMVIIFTCLTVLLVVATVFALRQVWRCW